MLCLYIAWLTHSFNAHAPAVATSLERLGGHISRDTSAFLAFAGLPSVIVAVVLVVLVLLKEVLVRDRMAGLWITIIVFMTATWCWQLAIAALYRPFRDLIRTMG